MSTRPLCGEELTNSEHWCFAIVQLIKICSVLKNLPFACWNKALCQPASSSALSRPLTYDLVETTVAVSCCAVFVTPDSETLMTSLVKQKLLSLAVQCLSRQTLRHLWPWWNNSRCRLLCSVFHHRLWDAHVLERKAVGACCYVVLC